MNNYDQNPALQSLKQFGSIVHDGISRTLDYANPVTLNRNITSAVMGLPDAMKRYDQNYREMLRASAAQPNPNHYFPTPFNNAPTQPNTTRSQTNPPGIENSPELQRRNHPQPTNAASAIKSAPMHEVNLQKYDYSTGQAFTPEQLDTHQREQKRADVNRPSVYDGQQITPSNWQSPGRSYNSLNKSELLTEDGLKAYDGDKQIGVPLFDNTFMTKRHGSSVHRPRTEEQRVYEGQQSHNRVLRGIAAYQNLNHYRRTGIDKPFPVQGGYDLSGPDPKVLQQQFENELAVRKHGLAITQRNDSLRPDPIKNKYKPRYSDMYDDNFNITGSRFDGSFNESTGQWIPADQNTAPVQLNQEQFEALSRARQLSSKSDDYTDAYLELLMELELDPNWYLENAE